MSEFDSEAQRQLDKINLLWNRFLDYGIADDENTGSVLDNLVSESRIFVDMLKMAEGKLDNKKSKNTTELLTYCKKQFWLL